METIDTSGWAVLLPRSGKRPASSAKVTLAWRLNTKAGGRTMTGYINVARAIVEQLGWPAKAKMAVRHDPGCTMLAVRPAEAGYSMKSMNGCATFQAYLPWIAHTDPKPAAPVEHRVLQGGELLIVLPDWARPAEPLKPATPAPAPVTQEKPPEIPDNANRPAPCAPAAAPTEPPAVKWTAERNQVLRNMYPQGASGEAMAEAVNRLPGPPATPEQCKAQAGNLGLKRAQPQKADARGPKSSDGVNAGASLPAQPKVKDEAFEMFDGGSSARDVAAELGVPLADASNWIAEWRLKKRAA